MEQEIPWTLLGGGGDWALYVPALSDASPVQARLVVDEDGAFVETLDGDGERVAEARLSALPREGWAALRAAHRFGSLVLVEEGEDGGRRATECVSVVLGAGR